MTFPIPPEEEAWLQAKAEADMVTITTHHAEDTLVAQRATEVVRFLLVQKLRSVWLRGAAAGWEEGRRWEARHYAKFLKTQGWEDLYQLDSAPNPYRSNP